MSRKGKMRKNRIERVGADYLSAAVGGNLIHPDTFLARYPVTPSEKRQLRPVLMMTYLAEKSAREQEKKPGIGSRLRRLLPYGRSEEGSQ